MKNNEKDLDVFGDLERDTVDVFGRDDTVRSTVEGLQY